MRILDENEVIYFQGNGKESYLKDSIHWAYNFLSREILFSEDIQNDNIGWVVDFLRAFIFDIES